MNPRLASVDRRRKPANATSFKHRRFPRPRVRDHDRGNWVARAGAERALRLVTILTAEDLTRPARICATSKLGADVARHGALRCI